MLLAHMLSQLSQTQPLIALRAVQFRVGKRPLIVDLLRFTLAKGAFQTFLVQTIFTKLFLTFDTDHLLRQIY